jgi:hypothetical protein
VKLVCPPDTGGCSGKLVIQQSSTTLGTAAISLSAASTKIVALSLTKAGKAKLVSGHSVTVTLIETFTDAAGRTGTARRTATYTIG